MTDKQKIFIGVLSLGFLTLLAAAMMSGCAVTNPICLGGCHADSIGNRGY